MNRALVDRIADAVLYEGYILYPYRPSVKNHQRWTFGGLYPEAYCQAQGDASAGTFSPQTDEVVANDLNTSGVFRVSAYQTFQSWTCGSVMRSIRGPMLPTISGGPPGVCGRGSSSASRASK